MPKYYIINNRSYSINQMAAIVGVHRQTMISRLKHMTPKQALSTPKLKHKPTQEVYVRGMHEYTREELAEANARGISKATLDHRLGLYHWEKERALTEPVQKGFGR